MQHISLIPGPVSVPDEILKEYSKDFGSPDLNRDFLALYNETEKKLGKILGTTSSVVIQTGEGMLGLWGALNSCLKKGDKVLAICSGVFGYGIASMAENLGMQVERIELPYNEIISDFNLTEEKLKNFAPDAITVVNCETPSGTLNPLSEIGRLKSLYGNPLLIVDSVASSGGVAIDADQNHIDITLGGSQKVLSAPASMTFTSVSGLAWEKIEKVNYQGYDALMPFKEAQSSFYFPYTPHWQGVAALNKAADLILEEGLESCFSRHEEVAAFCRAEIEKMGLELYCSNSSGFSPTVTAVKMPVNISWQDFDQKLRSNGLAVAGSYGPLAGKVFRIGHMGAQARLDTVKAGLEILKKCL